MSAEQHAPHAAPLDLDAIEEEWATMEVTGFVPARHAITDMTALLAEMRALRAERDKIEHDANWLSLERERLQLDLAAARAALAELLDWMTNPTSTPPSDEWRRAPQPWIDVARAALGRAEEDR